MRRKTFMSTLVTGPQLLVEQLREVVVAEIISDRPEVTASGDLRLRVERALSDLLAAGQSDIEQLKRYASFQARSWLGGPPSNHN
jgi:hypothetical protein